MGQAFSINTTKTTYHPDRKEWSSPRVTSIYNNHVSVGRLVTMALSAQPMKVAQICHEDGHEMRNWEVLRDSVRASLNIRDLGLVEGDVLGFVAYNTRNVAAVIFGALINGFPVSTVNPMFDANDVAHMFGITRPKVVVCDVANYEQVKKAMTILNNPAPIYVFESEEDNLDNQENSPRSVRELLKPHDGEKTFIAPDIKDAMTLPAFIVCSSGTTGPPKAIISTHAAFAWTLQDRSAAGYLTKVFGFSALYWASGIAVLLMGTILNVPRVIVAKPFSSKLGLEIIKKHQVDAMFSTPAQIQLMLQDETYKEDDMKSLKSVLCGGSMVPKWLRQLKTPPIINGYGLSEGGGIAMNGQLSGGCIVKILDEEGNRLGIGEEGEICAKFLYDFQGYYGNPESTEEMLIDGFLHTGDIGYFDEIGNLEVVDRKKDIFKYNNFHVSPSDIEKALEAVPGISLICVVGIHHPIYDCLPAAVIVRTEDSTLTETEVHQFCKENMSPHKWLRGGVYFIDELPMTPTGKILRRVIKTQATEMLRNRPDIGFKYE